MNTNITLDELRSRSNDNNWLADQPGAWFTLDVPIKDLHKAAQKRLAALPAEKPVHEDEFLFFRAFDGHSGLLADIGANMGQSAVSFRNVNTSVKIKSFEINPLLYPVLQCWEDHLEMFESYNFGLSDTTEEATIWIPVSGKFLSTPLASLRREVFDELGRLALWKKITQKESFELLSLGVQLKRFDELNLDPTFVKIDVEGAELFVLRGMIDTLARSHPIVMCEKSGNPEYVEWMAEQGFRHFAYQREKNTLLLIGNGPIHFLNTFFIHDSKLEFIKNHGITITGV